MTSLTPREGFNGRLRDELLNETLFWSLPHARAVLDTWRRDYNEERPHSKLGWMRPRDYARALSGEPASCNTSRPKLRSTQDSRYGLMRKGGHVSENNWAKNSHLPIRRRERKQQKFKSRASAQKFLVTHGTVYNVFNLQPHLIRRPTLRLFRAEAHRTWAAATAAA